MALGCDSEPIDDPEGDAVEVDASDEEDDGDDDDDAPEDPTERFKTGDPASGDLPASPCGNGLVDAGEECDDGWANGPNQECTNACTFNNCELDEDGNCIDVHWPAADVDYHPLDFG
jgi:hypothetical protein